MSRAATLSLLRQCASGISSPARHAVPTRTARVDTLRTGLRPYSTHNGQTEQSGQEGKKGEEKRENGNRSTGEKREPESGEVKESTASNDAHAECLKKLKAKEDEAVDLTSRLRYLQADFLNLQRNAAREKEQTKDFAITRFAGDLLETVDVLSMALKSVPESALKPPSEGDASDVSGNVPDAASQSASSSTSVPSDSASPSSSTTSDSTQQTKNPSEYLRELHHGVEMTHRLLLQTLFKYGVKPFDPTGDMFDPNKHEALYQAPIPGKKPGMVIDCQKTGFTIKERTLRAAQVGVASEPPNNSS